MSYEGSHKCIRFPEYRIDLVEVSSLFAYCFVSYESDPVGNTTYLYIGVRTVPLLEYVTRASNRTIIEGPSAAST